MGEDKMGELYKELVYVKRRERPGKVYETVIFERDNRGTRLTCLVASLNEINLERVTSK